MARRKSRLEAGLGAFAGPGLVTCARGWAQSSVHLRGLVSITRGREGALSRLQSPSLRRRVACEHGRRPPESPAACFWWGRRLSDSRESQV